jgi:tryptophanyl-tRNA synthetase
MSQKKRILSGMRPTGPLHMGNLLGALANWVKLQDEYECFYFIADWHALTSDYEDTARVHEYTREIIIDWLSAGLTPEKSTLFNDHTGALAGAQSNLQRTDRPNQ